jgi:hypothetical protein
MKYTVEEIAEYIAGWATAPFDEVEKVGKAVLLNALNQLEDDQDGIEAYFKRKEMDKFTMPQSGTFSAGWFQNGNWHVGQFTWICQKLFVEKSERWVPVTSDHWIFDPRREPRFMPLP